MKYKTGDILVENGKTSERKVLGVCGLLVFTSNIYEHDKYAATYTEEEIDAYFTLKLSEWKPVHREGYYFINTYGKIELNYWSGDSGDKFKMATKNYFRTREEAEARLSEIKKEAWLI